MGLSKSRPRQGTDADAAHLRNDTSKPLHRQKSSKLVCYQNVL